MKTATVIVVVADTVEAGVCGEPLPAIVRVIRVRTGP